MMRRVVIVGAGISGLSLAFRLRRRGYEVTLYEKEDEPGGNIKTRSQSGYLYELGPQTILADGKVLDFFRDLNLTPLKAAPASRNRYIYRNGRLIPVPLTPFSFFSSPLLSLRAKLRVLREPWIPPSAAEDESVADFVRRRLGQEFLDYIVAPFVSGVYAGDPEQLSVRFATRKIHALEREYGSLIRGAMRKKALGPRGSLVSFERGLAELVEKLSEGLDISRNCAVLRIRRKGKGFLIETVKGRDEAELLVVSSPAYTASYLLKEAFPMVSACLSRGGKAGEFWGLSFPQNSSPAGRLRRGSFSPFTWVELPTELLQG